MSYHHENIVWQSEDGTWNVGFFERIAGGSYIDDDYDPEWDDDYDYNRFQFASIGHATEDEATRAWGGPNPGSWDFSHYSEEDTAWTEKYEDLAAKMYEAEGASRPSPLVGKGSAGYYGPPRHRTLKALKSERDGIIESWAHYQLGNYANQIDRDHLKSLDDRIATMLPEASEEERATFEAQDAAHRDTLRQRVDEARRHNNGRGGFSMGISSHNNSGAIYEVSKHIGAAERAAKHRAKKSKKPAQKTAPKRAPRRTTQRGTGTCGKLTRAGRPCQRSVNCPVHR